MVAIELKGLIAIGTIFVLAIIVLSIGAEIMGEVGSDVDRYDTADVTGEGINNSIDLETTAASLTYDNLQHVVSVLNATDDAAVPTSNYTVDLEAGTFTLESPEFNYSGDSGNGAINISYAYYIEGVRWNISESAQEGLFEYSSWFPTIAIVIAAAIIIGLLFTVWAHNRRV